MLWMFKVCLDGKVGFCISYMYMNSVSEKSRSGVGNILFRQVINGIFVTEFLMTI